MPTLLKSLIDDTIEKSSEKYLRTTYVSDDTLALGQKFKKYLLNKSIYYFVNVAFLCFLFANERHFFTVMKQENTPCS